MKTINLTSPRARELIIEVIENTPAVMPEIASRQRIRAALTAAGKAPSFALEDADYTELVRLFGRYAFKGPFDDAIAITAAIAKAGEPAASP